MINRRIWSAAADFEEHPQHELPFDGAPPEPEPRVYCANGCGMDTDPEYAERHWPGGVCGLCRARAKRPELARVIRE